jgi:PadR family transcriptional regulator PadR
VNYTDQWLIQVRKGVVDLLVLRLLSVKGELHGYAIVKELLSIGPLVAGESTVYPVLKRLEVDSMLGSRWVTSESGPPRKYYAVSPEGSAFLAAAQGEWDSLVQSVARLKEEEGSE